MGRVNKIYEYIVKRRSDTNLSFRDMCNLLTYLGFDCRIRGDHHIFFRNNIDEIINLQPKKGRAKAYQVKQVRKLLIKYQLRVEEHNEQ